MLLSALPAAHQLESAGDEVGGGRVLTEVTSELTTGLRQPKPIASRDPGYENSGNHDDAEDTGSNLYLRQT